MPAQKLESHQNPVIKAAAKLRTNRGRQQAGQIIIDGEREIRRAAQSGIHLESVFIPESEPTERWDQLGNTLYHVSPRAHEKIAFGKRLEPVAIAKRPANTLDTSASSESISPDALFVVLEAVEKPGNIGAVLRSADGAGVTGVVLVAPLTDLYNPNAIRASLGTIFSMPVATLAFDDYAEWTQANQIRSLLAVCDEPTEYTTIDFSGRVAIVLGNEASGLSGNWGSLGNSENVSLPMRGIADSLNVSAAATVLMYEAMRIRKSAQES